MLSSFTELISCSYCNTENHVQIVRISHPVSAYLERVVSPDQCVYFNAPTSAALEVYESVQVSAVHTDTIPCLQLRLAKVEEHLHRDTPKNLSCLRAA